ncbi:winged helix-turn-helix transcriptional regulator [Candidatus Woesearchaeota archaeon]|nr:winged helix-turn-helix transcriptional regulator [Candidatus Woesearchaeota archaeon]
MALPIHKKALLEETPQVTPQKNPPKEPPKRTELEETILRFLINNPSATRKIIAEKLNLSPETVKEYLEKLKEKGFLKREGGRKMGYWVVTDKTLGSDKTK